jgi:glycosyltransferase involved in cell wall biosynthesis
MSATELRAHDVTVVIACFELGPYLGEAVTSALEQSAGAPRVVVVDDGSRGTETLAALDALPDGVDLVRQENRGAAAARNAGLARVRTPYALVLDADDLLTPDALAVMLDALEAEPGLGFAYGLMEQFGELSGVLRFPPYDAYGLLYRHTIGISALARTEVFAQTGGFDPAFGAYEDWELWVHALARGWRGRQVPVVTLRYRRRAGSKLGVDRRAYRAAFARLRAKHADLYARRAELARESVLGPVGRAWYRAFWGARPVPAVVETAVHRALWRTT